MLSLRLNPDDIPAGMTPNSFDIVSSQSKSKCTGTRLVYNPGNLRAAKKIFRVYWRYSITCIINESNRQDVDKISGISRKIVEKITTRNKKNST